MGRQTRRAGSREDRFGRSVAVSSDGETIIVGDVREPPDGEGVAHVYVRSGSLWNETAKLEGPSADFTFGDTVAVSSDGATILVLSSDGGHVFARSGQTWKRRASLVPTRSYVFLTTAALSPDGRVAVLTDDDVVGNVRGPGRAYVFVRTGTRWARAQTIVEPGAPRGWHEFGVGVGAARGGRTLILGAPLTDVGGIDFTRGVVHAPHVAQRVADLADRAAGSERFAHRDEEVLLAAGDVSHVGERLLDVREIPFGPHARRALELAPLRLGIEAMELDRLALRLLEPVDADDHALAGLDLPLILERRLLDLVLDEPLLDRRHRAAEPVHALDQLPRARLELLRQRLDEIGAAEWIGRVCTPRLVREQLLRPQRNVRASLGWKRQRLVEAVRVDRLRAACNRGQHLDRHADDVVLRLLRGERRATGLSVEPQRARLRVRRAKALLHDPRPEPPRRAELRHFLEEVVVRVEEEREPRAELVR